MTNIGSQINQDGIGNIKVRGVAKLSKFTSDEANKEIVRQHYSLHRLALCFCFLLGIIGGGLSIFFVINPLEVNVYGASIAGGAGGVIFATAMFLCSYIVKTCHVGVD